MNTNLVCLYINKCARLREVSESWRSGYRRFDYNQKINEIMILWQICKTLLKEIIDLQSDVASVFWSIWLKILCMTLFYTGASRSVRCLGQEAVELRCCLLEKILIVHCCGQRCHEDGMEHYPRTEERFA